MSVKLFGCGLDALDDVSKVELKKAYINALVSGRIGSDMPVDPYDALTPLITAISPDVTLGGKFSLPGWLGPRPGEKDFPLVNVEQYRKFIDREEIAVFVNKCKEWIEKTIFPDIPCMITVDHAMTAAPLTALSKKIGPENLVVVIIDSHLDAIPSHLRVPEGVDAPSCGTQNCGSFIAFLIEQGAIVPENIYVVGVSDYPPEGVTGPYATAYHSLIAQGITVLPKINEESLIVQTLKRELLKNKASHLYVSLDADAGAFTCMNAVRFLDFKGLEKETIMGIAGVIQSYIQNGKFQLAGIDVAEVDVHLLGLPGPDGSLDQTEKICAEFISAII